MDDATKRQIDTWERRAKGRSFAKGFAELAVLDLIAEVKRLYALLSKSPDTDNNAERK